MNRIAFIIISGLFYFISLQFVVAQSFYLPLNNLQNVRYQKYIYQKSNTHTAIRPYLEADIPEKDSIINSLKVSPEWQFLENFMNLPLYSATSKGEKLKLKFKPVVNYRAGLYRPESEYIQDVEAGIDLCGQLNKLSFGVYFHYLRLQLPSFMEKKVYATEILPHLGRYETVDNDNFTYLLSDFYLNYTFPQFVDIEIGQRKHFLGDGYRSLLLSDNSKSFPYLKCTVNVWKLKYTTMYAHLSDIDNRLNNNSLFDKYATSHILSWNIGKRLNLYAFESVIWSPNDSLGRRGIDINYLNPVIFMRPVEFSLGSTDNALFGAGFRLNPLTNAHLYGQVIIDDLTRSKLTNDSGWWGNKLGFQAGAKWFDALGVSNLMVQGEINYIRPYTYSHSTSRINYGHYHQPLAHPLGANLQEAVGIIHYEFSRWSLRNKTVIADYGADTDTISYGADIYKSYNQRNANYDIRTGQGLDTKMIYNDFTVAYLLNPHWNLQLELSLTTQRIITPETTTDRFFIFGGFHTLLFNAYFDQ